MKNFKHTLGIIDDSKQVSEWIFKFHRFKNQDLPMSLEIKIE